MFAATLFDYNGVLIDDEAVHFAAIRDAVRPLGIEVSERDYWELYLGFDDIGAFRAILSDHGRGPSRAQIGALVETKSRLYMECARVQLKPFDGAAALVRRRAESGPTLVVSGALRKEIEFGLSVLGVQDQVHGIIAAEDTSESKPSPEGYRLAKQRLTELGHHQAAECALVIEDSVAGIEAAKMAHLPCLAVAHTYPAERLQAAGADLVTENLAQVSDEALKQLYRRLYG